ncbi:unnamed protein product [Ophioblennius macclurei]
MDYGYQDRLDLEDDLYQEDQDDLEGSEVDSELEFHLYGQLHYSSNPRETEEQDDEGKESQESHQNEADQRTEDANGEPDDLGVNEHPSSAHDLLQRHLKKIKNKKEKQEKRNKRKSNLNGQISSCFEQVIVIDSSPDVISISEDSAEEDQGVCALKGHSTLKHQTSTPAQQDSRKKKSSCHAPVIVDSSSSEFESEESECESEPDSLDSSESDALENWMILGRGNQDGDQSISLNLEGGEDSDTDADTQEGSWLVSNRDREAQIYNKGRGPRVGVQRLSNRYYTDKNVHCRNCSKTGHLSKNCPEPKKLLVCHLCCSPGHISSECPNKFCNNCGLPGHFFSSCSERAYWHKQCHRCNMTGHFFDACPEIWRQYHITTKVGPPVKPPGKSNGRSPAYCYNCGRKEHFGHVCTRQRMFNGVYPNTPFINTYDTVKEINRRQHRMKVKAKELKENGFFPPFSNTPLTPGPPRKKQKFSNQKNHHTPCQTPSNYRPNSSHIFFRDSEDGGGATTPRKYKPKQEDLFRSAKPWKPKRPVPSSRSPAPSKLVLDEADDLPRGGRAAASSQGKRKRGLIKPIPLALPEGNNARAAYPAWTGEQKKRRPKSKEERRNKKIRYLANKAQRKKRPNDYPTDENLFAIKQRKRKR